MGVKSLNTATGLWNMPIDPATVQWDEKPQVQPENIVWDEEPPKAKKRSFGQDIGRALGLTARHAIAGSLGLADLFATPIRMAGNAIRPGTFTSTGGQAIADIAGLPTPENQAERIVGNIASVIAGTGGAIKGAQMLAGKVVPQAEKALRWLAQNPKLQVQAAVGAGGGVAAAKEADLGPYGELALALAGGVAAPAILRTGRTLVEPLMDIGATIGAPMGSKRAVTRLMTDAVERGFGESKGRVRNAMYSVTEPVAGAKPTVAEALAEANLKSPDQFGGWGIRLQRDLTGAKGVEDVLPSVAKQQRTAIRAKNTQLRSDTTPMREKALEAANVGGVKAKTVTDAIDTLAAIPENKGSTLISKTLAATKDKIAGLADDVGIVDAKSLYAVRKELGNTISTFSKETANWDKKVTAGLERDIQKAIDDAIEAAGGTGWKDYLAAYHQGKQEIAKHLARQREAKRISAEVKPTAGSNIAPGEIPKPPTLLNRAMMLANYGIRMLGSNANDPVVKELTRRMANPREFAELLNRPATDPLRMRAMEAVKRGEIAAGVAMGINSGQQ